MGEYLDGRVMDNSFSIGMIGDSRLSKNGLIKAHWRTSKQHTKIARANAKEQAIKILSRCSKDWVTLEVAQVDIVHRYARTPLDYDGLACMAAPIIDGIVDAGILRDDSPKVIARYNLGHQKVATVPESCIFITVSPAR